MLANRPGPLWRPVLSALAAILTAAIAVGAAPTAVQYRIRLSHPRPAPLTSAFWPANAAAVTVANATHRTATSATLWRILEYLVFAIFLIPRERPGYHQKTGKFPVGRLRGDVQREGVRAGRAARARDSRAARAGAAPDKTRQVDLSWGREGFDFLGCHLRKRLSGRIGETQRKRLYFRMPLVSRVREIRTHGLNGGRTHSTALARRDR